METNPPEKENVNALKEFDSLWLSLKTVFICVITSVITSCLVMAFKAPYVDPANPGPKPDPKAITVPAAQLQQLTEEHEKLTRVVTALVLQSRDGSLRVPVGLIRDPSPYGLASEIKDQSVILTVKARK